MKLQESADHRKWMKRAPTILGCIVCALRIQLYPRSVHSTSTIEGLFVGPLYRAIIHSLHSTENIEGLFVAQRSEVSPKKHEYLHFVPNIHFFCICTVHTMSFPDK